MKDKEKQNSNSNLVNLINDLWVCQDENINGIALELIKKGYRKIPQNAFLLTKEEYAELQKNDDKLNEELRGLRKELEAEWKDRRQAEEDLRRAQHNYKIGLSQSQNRNKKLKEEKEALKKQVEYWEDQTKVAREETDNAVKENTEQIFNDVFNACKKRFDETKGYTCKGDIEFVLGQLAERYCVKIKEQE